ncbi:hypothetical protein [Halalkalibacter alkalisediminis]|uniref:Uncharacterized protein n=1 Tax=Halalkalibacter alkalisediminis TaxID=935616 RepID=A0ABV6NAQ3_9BACI|nr:hypothetical protein [Halalkalibacter alkalisediminis]
MQSKQVVIGILIFALVTIISYSFLYGILHLGEGISVIFGLILGGTVEFIYRRKSRDH